MARYIDIHSGFVGATEEQLRAAHQSRRRVEHQEPATPVRIARVHRRVGDHGEVGHQRPPSGGDVGAARPGHGVAQVQQQAGGQLHVLRKGTRGQQEEALGRGEPLDLVQQPGLADTGLTRQQQQMTGTGAYGGNPARRKRQ